MEILKKKRIQFGILVVLGFVGFLISQEFSEKERTLTFENHNPMRADMNERDLRELFMMHKDCFADAKKENLRLYFMKYKSLDSVLAAQQADQVIANMKPEEEKSFGDMVNAFVMRDRGELIGFFNCREEDEVTHGSIMVFNVCVKKERRGRGYGKELMLHSFEKCIRPGKDLTLTVYRDDTKVVNFYKELGFEIVNNMEQWDHLFPYFNKYLMKYKAEEHRHN